MKITDYQQSLLEMMKKFGPAISSMELEKREAALQDLVVAGYSTMVRSDGGNFSYAITAEGRVFLDDPKS